MPEKFFLDGDEVLWYSPSMRDFWSSSVTTSSLKEMLERRDLILDDGTLEFLNAKDPSDLYLITINYPENLELVLKHFGLDKIFRSENISADLSSKGYRISEIVRRVGVEKAIFVDDREGNLCDVYRKLPSDVLEMEFILMD
ncbi:MAG: hypothetical protein ACE5PM_02905, partial [Candidatus Hydrothermarchaeales archaeon]